MRIGISMRTAVVFAALSVAVVAAGCSSGGYSSCSACDGSPTSNLCLLCPKVPANCCGWDFYVPCDMIEGRAVRECGSPCQYSAGQVVSRSYAVPAPCAPNGPYVTPVEVTPAPTVAPAPAGPAPLPPPVVAPAPQ
jgi:hypothetical protein